MKFEFTKQTPLLYETLTSDKPLVIHEGGTSSSKTYSNIQACFTWAINKPGSVITIVAEDTPALKKGAIRDAGNILSEEPRLAKEFGDFQKSYKIYESLEGSIIEFASFETADDAKHGKRDFLFLNEVNSIPKPICEELMMRTSQKVIMDFNPNARFWVHDDYEAYQGERDWFVSNYKHNPFIDEKVLQKILSYEPTPENIERGTANEYRWLVYGLGQVGRLEGLVFPDWKTGKLPDDYKWRVFGMDFGYTNDPTTLVEIRYAQGALYWKEHIYETGMTNPDISKKLSAIEHPKSEMIVADSAEPKSIAELRSPKEGGWHIVGAEKGADSINQGIDAIKRYNNYIDPRSKNLIEEFSSYTWKKDKDGKAMNKPIDAFNHGIDAGRYALSKKILRPSKKLEWT